MDILVDEAISKIEKLNIDLSDDELSAMSAGLKDILASYDKLTTSLTKIKEAKDNDEFQNAMVELQIK